MEASTMVASRMGWWLQQWWASRIGSWQQLNLSILPLQLHSNAATI